ncbi:hypothetical protein, partial [Klebsiella pneumoniae]|uniref:hypothetical protein n=1 Tax=Klebsiella pneumoniae TaxID=573 RepID=UPI001C6F5EB1
AIAAMDQRTWQALTTGHVELPRRRIHAGLWLKTIVQKFVLFYCALVRAYTKIRNFPGINIHNFYTNDARVRHLHPLIPYYGSVFIFK